MLVVGGGVLGPSFQMSHPHFSLNLGSKTLGHSDHICSLSLPYYFATYYETVYMTFALLEPSAAKESS